MEVYILDDLLRRTSVLDRFESMVWAERYSSYGDFEFVIHSTNETRKLLQTGTRLAITESDRVMEIKEVEDKTDNEGRNILSVKGLEILSMLDERVATDGFAPTGDYPKWNITGIPGDVMRTVVNQICVVGLLSAGDIIPHLQMGSIYPPDTIPEPTVSITAEFDPQTVYAAIKSVADVYNLGFRIVRKQDLTELYFDVYTGDDKTTLQTLNPAVIFSPTLNNLSNTTELTTTKNMKNVAYVFAKNDSKIVYAEGVDPTVSGFERRVLVVKADDLTDPAGPSLTAQMQKKGLDELAKYRPTSAFDGEVSQLGSYRYGVDYNLGDLVEMRNTDGVTNIMRVTEQIFASDAQGDRSYPTLSVDRLITPGSWEAYGTGTWDDALGHWDDL